MATTIKLKADQDQEIKVTVKDRKGNPTTVQDPVFSSNDTTIATVGPSQLTPADPLTARVSAVGPTGGALIKFDGDADLGSGVKPVFGSADCVVDAGDAAVFEIAPVGEPVDQP